MKKVFTIYCLLILFVFASNLRAQNWGTKTDCATNPPDFTKLSYEQAKEAVYSEDHLIYWGAKKICPEYIDNLVYQLRHGKVNHDNKVQGILLLGNLSSWCNTNAIEFLIENIDLENTKIEANSLQWAGKYPAKDSLLRIGMPVIDPILTHLPGEGNALRRHLMCEVLVKVEGKKGEFFNEADGKTTAQNQVNKLLAAESDTVKQSNLKLALKELEK